MKIFHSHILGREKPRLTTTRSICSATSDSGLRTSDSDEAERRAAFSLIEVLVATALLVMVVGMIGFVFRQSSMSWDSGIQRAEGISQVRAVMGSIERDLRMAVDAREFGIQNNFSGSSLEFIALSDPEAGSDDRVPTKITYSNGSTVKRTAQRLKCNNGKWSTSGASETSTLLKNASSTSTISITFNVVKDDDDPDGLPAYVTISADITHQEKFSGLEVRSYGPNGKPNDKDDIVVN